MARAPWVIAVGTSQFRCDRCGTTHQVKLPSPIWEWVAISDGFIKQHQNCQEPAADE